jgi:hypothetical protein
MNEYVYLNFPVQMMQGGFTDIKAVCLKAINYGTYDYMVRNGFSGVNGFSEALKELDITYGNHEAGFKSSKDIYQQTKDSIEKLVTVSIKRDLLFEYFKNDKSEFEIAVFLGYVALKSIIGKKPYIKITNDYLLARMCGYSSIVELEKDYSPERCKYSTRYHLDKVKTKLESDFGLKLYGQKTRGFYVTFKLSLLDLVYHAELKRESRKEKERKALKTDTINQVLNHFKSKK